MAVSTRSDRPLYHAAASSFASTFAFAITAPFLPVYLHSQRGLTLSQIGILFALLGIVRAGLQAVTGLLSDRIGRHGPLSISQLLRAATLLVLALTISYNWPLGLLITLLTIDAFCAATFLPSLAALIGDLVPQSKQVWGFAVTRTARNLAWAIGPSIGGLIAEISYTWLFLLACLASAASGLAFMWSWNNGAASYCGAKPTQALPSGNKTQRVFIGHCILSFLLFLVVAQLIVPLSLYAVTMANLSKAKLGFLYTINGGLIVCFQVLLSRSVHSFKLSTQIVSGAFLFALGYGVLGLRTGFVWFALVVSVVTLAEMILAPASLALTSRLAPPNGAGKAMGIYNLFLETGWLLGPLYGSVYLNAFPQEPALAWVGIASLAAVAAGGYLFLRRSLPLPIERDSA